MSDNLPAHQQRPSLLGFLPKRLFRAERPLSYLGLAWPLVAVPSLALAAIASTLSPQAAGPAFAADGLPLFALLVLAAPMIETLIMGTTLLFLQRLFGTGPAVLLSAAGWAVAHSLSASAWGLVIWWPFLVFSTAFLVWRSRGFWRAWMLVSVLHGLQNLIPSLIVIFRQS